MKNSLLYPYNSLVVLFACLCLVGSLAIASADGSEATAPKATPRKGGHSPLHDSLYHRPHDASFG